MKHLNEGRGASDGDDGDTSEEDSGNGFLATSRRGVIAGASGIASGLALNGLTREAAGLESRRKTREFRVHALPIDIVYNKFGLHQPDGAMYVLEENIDAVRAAEGVAPGTDEAEGIDTSVIEPLVLRANQGDRVNITLVNHLERQVSMHQTGMPYRVNSSDGMVVGFNGDSTVPPGEEKTYQWQAIQPGTYEFHDGATQPYFSDELEDGKFNGFARGLFGAFVVEPKGATWTDPRTGEQLRSGTRADIHVPNFPDHREFLAFYHDPEGVVNADGDEPEQPTHGINYRAAKTSERVDELPKDSFYSSWTHGDPGGGDTVFRSYSGDPIKMVTVGTQTEENHVHHLHGHRWKEIPRLTNSDTIDSQSVGAGATYENYLVAGHGRRTTRPDLSWEEAFNVGAGYVHGSVGDYLFHCHLFPHYAEGMNGIFRVLDKQRDDLVPLPNNDPTIPANSQIPGFPEFMEEAVIEEDGEQFSPKPPYERGSITDGEKAALGRAYSEDQPQTDDEQAALGGDGDIDAEDDLVSGAPYADPCIDEIDGKIHHYTIEALNADVVYNDAGDHDPNGMVFALEEYRRLDDERNVEVSETVGDATRIRDGEMDPEPLVIRANVGDCVEVTLRNQLDNDGISNHPHFVGFDPLGSDSTIVGYNYDSGAEPDGQEFGGGDDVTEYRWYADEEGAIFFHDHISGIDDGMHGTFASLIVEPKGSKWLDPHTGDPIRSGTQAIIENPEGNDFRELSLLYHDFAPLRERGSDDFVTDEIQHDVNAGVSAINYRNTPYYRRRQGPEGDDADPAYVHSSKRHGDPSTPVFETYANDPVRIRLVQAMWEEQHNFVMHGLRPNQEGQTPQDSVSQIIGPSESFTFTLRGEASQAADVGSESHLTRFDHLDNPDGLPVRDYLYGSMMLDDLWNGMWGFHRIWGQEVEHIEPLPDREPPSGDEITIDQLREMGHPVGFGNLAEQLVEVGHKGKLIYDEDDDTDYPPHRDERKNENVGEVPPKATSPGDPCPDDAPVRTYNITAFQTDIEYNDYGDHDPYGIVYALDEDVEAIKSGEKPAEPLIIRANQGECIEINLTNDLPGDLDNDHPHPRVRAEREWPRSQRVSLHPQLLTYDVQGSDGATVGFNFDQTIAPGETITYRWYADREVGASVLWDMADVRSTRHHAAHGKLVVEPEGSTWHDPVTGDQISTGDRAVIKQPDGSKYREYVILFTDGMHIVNPDGSCVVPRGGEEREDLDTPCPQIGDPEDQGFGAINNRSEPFQRRFDRGNDNPHLVFSSEEHGDPNTPVFRALPGDPVLFRVSQAGSQSRGVSFHLSNHRWKRFRNVGKSPIIGVDDVLSPGKSIQIEPVDGAGGLMTDPGDYIYQELKTRGRLESGMWGIFRVRNQRGKFDRPILPLRRI